MSYGPGGHVVLPPVKWRPSPNRYIGRGGAKVHLVVLHDTEGSYSGAVATFQEPSSQVSAHVVLREDGNQATQCVAWDNAAWSCEMYNHVSDNIEMAGFESQGYSLDLWKTAARVVAFRLKQRGITPVWSRDGNTPGFCRHYDLGARGGGHTDPTTNLDKWHWFCELVKAQYERGDFVRKWGR